MKKKRDSRVRGNDGGGGDDNELPRLLIYAGIFALAELALGLTIGQFVLRGRAEAGIFLAFRPWLLVPLILVAMRWQVAMRWRLYLLSVLLASAAEALLVHLLGAPAALTEAARGPAAGGLLLLLLDAIAILCARWSGWRGLAAAGMAGLALMLVPGPLTLFERIAIPPEPGPRIERPPVTLLTGLPLVWGEGGAAPPAAYALLSEAYTPRLIDVATPETMRTGRLLIAQPRPPGPSGLVAIDRWVRDGGRALILTDPALRWPSDLALGDPRRPPLDDGLAPLLTHWGLSVEPPGNGPTLATRDIAGRRLVMAAPGRFVAQGPACAIREQGLLADCRLGRGRALLLADADLLHDLLWIGPGDIGIRRMGRLADNAAFIVDRLDGLGGSPPRKGDHIAWITRPDSFVFGILAAIAVGLSSLLVGFGLSTRVRHASSKKDSDRLIHRQ